MEVWSRLVKLQCLHDALHELSTLKEFAVNMTAIFNRSAANKAAVIRLTCKSINTQNTAFKLLLGLSSL